MAQALEIQTDVTIDSIADTVGCRIVEKWKQRGVCPWHAGDQSPNPSCQNWTEREQTVTPQQNNLDNTYSTHMWHIYSIELNVCREGMVN